MRVAVPKFVEVTHPFHPWRGRRFQVHDKWRSGGKSVVRCIIDDEEIRALPVTWTDLREADEFERASAGHCWFRHDDLEALRAQIDALMDDQK